jgi:uncharacterized protein
MKTLDDIDLIEFIANQQQLTTEIDVSQLKRLQEICQSIGNINVTIKTLIKAKNKPVLGLFVCGKISASCQSCLKLLEIDINIDIKNPVYSHQNDLEQALLAGNNIDECDSVVASSSFNLLEFIEDEVILSLPIATRHEQCKLD